MREQVRRILYLYGVATDMYDEKHTDKLLDVATDAIMHETQQPTVTPFISTESPVGDTWVYLRNEGFESHTTPCSNEEEQA